MKYKLKELQNNLIEPIDVFICSSSFEERCFAIPENIKGINIPCKIIFYFNDLYDRITQNANKLQQILGDGSDKIHLTIGDPAQMVKRMSKSLDSVMSKKNNLNFLIDITTFSHEGLLILFRLFQLKIRNADRLFICYNGASEYSTNEIDPAKKWLSKGVNSIRSVLGYPGFFDPSQKNHLVILFGFERERTKKLIDIFEYDIVSIAFGGKNVSISDDHQKLNQKRHEELFDFYTNTKKFEISLIDPIVTKNNIIEHIDKFDGCNTVIAPLNNKISTIGAGLVTVERPDVQLCYLTANSYNFEFYSEPGDDAYFIEIEKRHLKSASCNL